MPFPAVVGRPYGEIVAANAALAVLTEGAAPQLLEPPVNVLRLAVHPDGMGQRVENLAEWVDTSSRTCATKPCAVPTPVSTRSSPSSRAMSPPLTPGPDHLGFAVPLRLASDEGELRLITTLTSFATAVDITLSELHLEAFLPADDATAEILRRREQRGTRP
jgi:hypothetical protein